MPFFNGESSSDTLIDRGLEYFFHVGPCDSTLIASTYDYLDLNRESLGIESVAICGSDDDGGSMFVKFCEKEAKERNCTIGTSIIYPTDAATLSAECMKLKSCGADVLLIFAQNPASIIFLQTMQEMDINFKSVITARGGFISTEFFDTVGDTAVYLMTENPWSLDSDSDKPWVAEMNQMCIDAVGCGVHCAVRSGTWRHSANFSGGARDSAARTGGGLSFGDVGRGDAGQSALGICAMSAGGKADDSSKIWENHPDFVDVGLFDVRCK